MKKFTLLIVFSFLISCAGSPVDSTQTDSYFNTHAKLMQSLPATALDTDVKNKFQMVLGDFKKTMTEENLRGLYADELYFNDTLVTIRNIDDLVVYMANTTNNASAATVEIVDVAKSDSDYYLRWSMDISFEARGKQIRSKSIGMTQVRFNDQGKVVFHQDYWDSANAFYQHLPIVGRLVQRIRNGIH